jgi:hypothetical protein
MESAQRLNTWQVVLEGTLRHPTKMKTFISSAYLLFLGNNNFNALREEE